MSTNPTVQQANQALADKVNAEALGNPQSPYAGKFVGIANGHVVAVADDADEVIKSVRQIEPDPSKTFVLEAGLDYDEPQEIWSA